MVFDTVTKKPGLDINIQKLDWVLIYYSKIKTNEYQCNVCQNIIECESEEKKLSPMLGHIHSHHKEVFDLHKLNPDEAIGFRIEFLQLNMLEEDSKSQAVTVEVTEEQEQEDDKKFIDTAEVAPDNVEFVLVSENHEPLLTPAKPKVIRSIGKQQTKRSWVWKYFENISSVIFRCNLCNVVLSIKGNNTNNMNRHVKSKHPVIYKTELMSATYTRRRDTQEQMTEVGCEVEIPIMKGDEISAASTPKQKDGTPVKQALRRSWIWTYFTRLSSTIAQCKLCSRKINHGGYATGNMHRHLKFLHKDVYINSVTDVEKVDCEDVNWIWKLFTAEDNAYCCKICSYRSLKTPDIDKNVHLNLYHLKNEHGVISGDQIISGADCESTDMDECTVAVDFLKGAEM